MRAVPVEVKAESVRMTPRRLYCNKPVYLTAGINIWTSLWFGKGHINVENPIF
jgi:hypothetical protein